MAKACGIAEVETLYFEDCTPKRRRSFMLREDTFDSVRLQKSGLALKRPGPRWRQLAPSQHQGGEAYPAASPPPSPPGGEKAPEKAKG
jgi:hypothetical protein